MNTQDEIMRTLLDNPNTQRIAKLMQEIVMPAIASMTEDQHIEVIARIIIEESITVEMVMKR